MGVLETVGLKIYALVKTKGLGLVLCYEKIMR
jgi:hypothetical protein